MTFMAFSMDEGSPRLPGQIPTAMQTSPGTQTEHRDAPRCRARIADEILRQISQAEAIQRRVEALRDLVEGRLAVGAHVDLAPVLLELPRTRIFV